MRCVAQIMRFSKLADRLSKARQKVAEQAQDADQSLQQTSQQTTATSRFVPSNDLNAVVRNTDTSIIYANQPPVDTLNLTDITSGGHQYSRSREGERLKFKISGEESQVAIVDLFPGDVVRSESDKILFMTEGVNMETHTGGGVGSMFNRFFGGSSLFVTDYTYGEETGYGRVAFAETFPSKILPIRLDDYDGVINCKKGTYICGTNAVDINITFQKKISAGFFGGEGFVLQQLKSTQGGQTVLLRAGGSLIKRTLRQGEKIKVIVIAILKVAPGLVVAFQNSIAYDIEMISVRKNLLNMFGGARSLFQATFTGPGDLFLQSLSFESLIEEIASRVPVKSGVLFGGRGGGDGDGDDDGDADLTSDK